MSEVISALLIFICSLLGSIVFFWSVMAATAGVHAAVDWLRTVNQLKQEVKELRQKLDSPQSHP